MPRQHELSFAKSPEQPFYNPEEIPWQPYQESHLEMPLFRWTCRWFYQCRYPATRMIRFSLFRIGNLEVTIGGILFICLIYGLLGVFGYLSYTSTTDPKKRYVNASNAVSVAVILLFSIAGRNSLWGFLLGISYERIAIWHKVVSISVLGLGVLHGYAAWNFNAFGKITGLILLGSFGFLVLISYPTWFANFHNTFLILHRLGIVMIIVFLIIHGAGLAIVGVGFWAFDVLVRIIWMWVNKKRVKLVQGKTMPGDVVEIKFMKNNFTYAAGQFVFVCIPKASFWEQHPFTISSAPYQKEVTLHIKVLGDWTKHLAKTCKMEQTLDMYIDGPYGSPSIELDNPDKQLFVFIAGGIGVTPMISMANSLLDQYIRGRPLCKLYFFWAFRDLSMAQAVIARDDLLTRFHQNIDLIQQSTKVRLREQVLEIRFFLTANEERQVFVSNNQSNGRKFGQFVTQQKMDIPLIFQTVKVAKKQANMKDVCVLSCGPSKMLSQVSSLSKSNGYSHQIEVFEY